MARPTKGVGLDGWLAEALVAPHRPRAPSLLIVRSLTTLGRQLELEIDLL
jgi:hypothetical protein